MTRFEEFLYDLNLPVPMFRDLVAIAVLVAVTLAVFKLATYAEISFQIGRIV